MGLQTLAVLTQQGWMRLGAVSNQPLHDRGGPGVSLPIRGGLRDRHVPLAPLQMRTNAPACE